MTLSLRAAVKPNVPENAFAGDEPLVAVMRGSFVGGVHRGAAAVVTAAGDELLAIGDTNQPVFLRSAAKPFQLMPAVLAGAIERFGLREEEIAVLASSHHGEAQHLEAVLAVLGRAGLDESALRCGSHPPLNLESARRRWREGIEATPACNNCSGAHTGMILACLARGWSLDGYGSSDHPLQIETRQLLAQFAGIVAGRVEMAVDNCDVPAFRMPVRAAALAYARLATGHRVANSLAGAAQRIRDAMIAHPEMVGGAGSFDTALMEAGAGEIVAKGGAEGFQGVGLLSRGAGLAIKISDGGARAAPPATLAILSALDMLSEDALKRLTAYRRPEIRNWQGELVGTIAALIGDEGGV